MHDVLSRVVCIFMSRPTALSNAACYYRSEKASCRPENCISLRRCLEENIWCLVLEPLLIIVESHELERKNVIVYRKDEFSTRQVCKMLFLFQNNSGRSVSSVSIKYVHRQRYQKVLLQFNFHLFSA